MVICNNWSITTLIKPFSLVTSTRLYGGDLVTGEREKVTFEKLESINDKIAKYSITGTIPSSEMNGYLEEYKEEMNLEEYNNEILCDFNFDD